MFNNHTISTPSVQLQHMSSAAHKLPSPQPPPINITINTLQDHTQLHKQRNYRPAGSQPALQQTTRH